MAGVERKPFEDCVEESEAAGEKDNKEDSSAADYGQLAMGKLNDQGIHECEVWTTGAEGEKDWRNCTKNPGHEKFIPAREFSLQHLPEPFRDEDVFEYVRLLCERTVRIVVKYTSTERPNGYPFANYRGKYVPHTGTGMIHCYEYPEDVDYEKDDTEEESDKGVEDRLKKVEKSGEDTTEIVCFDTEPDVSDDDDDDDVKIYEYFDAWSNSCPCPECSMSDTPHRQYGYIYVNTAKHVVFDKVEARNTVIEINYDDEHDKASVKTLYGVDINVTNLNKGDWNTIQCITHDRELYIRLYDSARQFSELRDEINEKYWETPSRLCLIVSHPHGWYKRVTVGEWITRKVTDVNLERDEMVEYTYNTPTCRGSSGAPVITLGMKEASHGHKTWVPDHHVHKGAFNENLNISGIEEERNADSDDENAGEADGDDNVHALHN